MKILLLASLFFILPSTTFAVPTKPEQFEKLENEFSLECKKYGAKSCAARFISSLGKGKVLGSNPYHVTCTIY